MPDKNPCDLIKGQAKEFCKAKPGDPPSPGKGGGGAGDGITGGASQHVQDLAEYLIKKINGLIAPKQAPLKSDSAFYEPFLWLGQHLAVAIFTCVVVICALTAWQGVPRLRQLGASTGWTLAAVVGMASVPGIVVLLNGAVSEAFTAAFDSNETTLFGAISKDMKKASDSGNPLAILIIVAALVVALGFALLVFMTRQLGILAFVCMAPLVLASLARGGDMTAVKQWAMRLLGLMFAPMVLLLVSPFVDLAKGSLVMDATLLVAADVLMLRMIFHGIPYFGPKVAGAVRSVVERNTDNRLVRDLIRAGVPDVYEQENSARALRTVDTPGRAMYKDRGVLFAAYGFKQQQRPGQLTTASAVAQVRERASRTAQLTQARQQARAAARPQAATDGPRTSAGQAAAPNPRRAPNAPQPAPARPSQAPKRSASPPTP
ncbi:hypothetical protein GCM10010218_64110 [Streptomyces mashuensis]|uniref:Integral membrane protein n=1 Tax=Streptomyces mashuensis TaxID=33904 RepID=A0A919EGT5_9ACTN|nr:hypothetical protein [Streptomyces mashuensis]GHF74169.1 hypothetical protein GCM10010218_64110 [Streptomyces mashuensis]